MIVIENKKNIRISKGDTLDIKFNVSGFEIKDTDTIIFSVKKEYLNDDSLLIRKELNNIAGNKINIVLNSEEMSKLPLGTNYYDLVCISDDKKVTFNFPAKIIIERVVHNE